MDLDQPTIQKCAVTGINPRTKKDYQTSRRREQQGKSGEREISQLFGCNNSVGTETQLASHLCISPSSKKFQCLKCDKSFDYSLYLLSHMKTHKEKLILSCEICDMTFSDVSCLRNHKLTHGRKRFKCGACSASYDTTSALKLHENKRHQRKTFRRTCKPCGKVYISKSGWQKHMEVHGMRKCTLCDKFYKNTPSHFDTHMKKHKREKPFRCKICEKWFPSKSEVIKHVDVEHKNTKRWLKYGCVDCKKSFAISKFYSNHQCNELFHCRTSEDQFRTMPERDAHERDAHQTTANNEPGIKSGRVIPQIIEVKIVVQVETEPTQNTSFVFPIADAGIFNSDLRVKEIVEPMDTHEIPQLGQEVNHQSPQRREQQGNSGKREKPKLFLCNLCNKSFKTETELTSHLCVPPPKKEFQCPKCDKSFDYSLYLSSHMKTHKEKCMIFCEICGKTFSDVSSLHNHKLTHGIKRFSCEICDASYATSSELKHHENQQHRKMKEFRQRCRPCGKVFISQTGWEKHMKIHGKKKCPLCGRYFKITTGQFDTHMEKHKREKPFRCKICEKWFRSKSDVIAHVDVKHKSTKRWLKYGCVNCKRSFAVSKTYSNHQCTDQFPDIKSGQIIPDITGDDEEIPDITDVGNEVPDITEVDEEMPDIIEVKEEVQDITELKEEVQVEPESTQNTSFVFPIDDADIGNSDLRVKRIITFPEVKVEADSTQNTSFVFPIDDADIGISDLRVKQIITFPEVKVEPESTQNKSFLFPIDDAGIGNSDLGVKQNITFPEVKVEPKDTQEFPQIKQEVDESLCAAQGMMYIFKMNGTDISVGRP